MDLLKPILDKSVAPTNTPKQKQTEEIFSLLVNAIDEYAIFALDPDGKILTWNLGAQRLKGYRYDEVVGTSFERFYTQPDIDRGHPAQELKQAAAFGKYEEEGWRVRKDGSWFWANVVITALRGNDGALRGFGKVTRDLTQKRNAEIALKESEERFRLLVQNVTDYAILTLDPLGIVTSWNAGAERIKGYRSEEIIGKHFSTFYPRSEIENEKPQMELRIAADEGRYEEEGWRVRRDGTMFWASVIITAMRTESGSLKGFAKVTRDLTARRQAEEALRQSQERYRLLIDNINDYAVIFLDSRGRITSWNSGATKITGYQSKEILGSHFSKFYRPEDIAAGRLENELRTANQLGRYEEEGIRVRKDGTQYVASVIITSVKDDIGTLLGYSKVVRDITESKTAEKLLRESEERFRLMVDSVEDYAIFMLDPEGRVDSWNRGAERSKGYTADEIMGKHFSIFYPEEDVKAGKPDIEIKGAIRNGRFEDEGWRVRKDGSRFWANVILTSIYDKSGALVGFSKVTRNLTERKRAEDALREAYQDLENRIALRTKELSEAKTKAEAAVKTRDEFFSMASHELKTPLSSLKLQTQIRKRNVKRGDFSDFAPEHLEDLCEDDERQVERLTFLVDNMLDISRLTSGNFRLILEEFSLNELIADVIERLEPILKEAGCACTFHADKEVVGTWDRHRIEQVFTNLLSNAGKYAPGKPVHIEMNTKPDLVTISVRDSGLGIAKSEQARVFNPFERITNQTTANGLGLGLYITKQIIDAHHGGIGLESNLGEGANFIVTLPIISVEKSEIKQ